YDDLQAKNAERVARAQMARSLGLDDGLEGRDITGRAPTAEPGAETPDFKRLATATPELAQATASEDAADWGIKIARSGFFPSLDLSAPKGRRDTEFFPNAYNYWSMGVKLSLPLFSGGSDFYGTRSAVASWTSAMTARENVSRQELAKLEQAYASYVEAVAKL